MNRHYTDPKIYPANPSSNDMGKDWFIWFRIFDPASRRWIQKSYKRGINNFKRYRERLAEANAVRQDLVEALKEGWTPFNKGQSPVKDIRITTVREALDHIMNIKSRDVKKKTKGTYQFIIDLLKQWLGKRGQKDLELDRFTHNMAQQYMDDLLIDRNYSGRTYNDHIIILSTFFNVIAKRKWINENPFHNIERKKTTTGRNLAYTDHEKEQLRKLLHKKDRQLYFLTQFMYYCFIRRTEMVKIKVSDINLHTKTIIIRGDNAKNGMQESVVIPVGLEPILEEMRIHHYPDEHHMRT
jgi:integrase/recombinase XerD